MNMQMRFFWILRINMWSVPATVYTSCRSNEINFSFDLRTTTPGSMKRIFPLNCPCTRRAERRRCRFCRDSLGPSQENNELWGASLSHKHRRSTLPRAWSFALFSFLPPSFFASPSFCLRPQNDQSHPSFALFFVFRCGESQAAEWYLKVCRAAHDFSCLTSRKTEECLVIVRASFTVFCTR